MKKTVDSLGLSRFLLVADRGTYSGTNVLHVTAAGNVCIDKYHLGRAAKDAIVG